MLSLSVLMLELADGLWVLGYFGGKNVQIFCSVSRLS